MQVSFFIELSEYTKILKIFHENPTLKPQDTISKMMRYIVTDFLYHHSSSMDSTHYLWKEADYQINPVSVKIKHTKFDPTFAKEWDF